MPRGNPSPKLVMPACAIVPIGETETHEAGRLLGITKTANVVQKTTILTSDHHDMERLVRASGREIAVVAI